MTSVYCRYCYKDIKDRDELVTATNYLRIRPYHYRCFEEVEQETFATVRSWKPINGPMGNIAFVILLIFVGIMALTDVFEEIGNLLGALALYPIILRVLSFFMYELRVPVQKSEKKKF